jgi:hypothetical protein
MGMLPDQEPDAMQAVALVLDQVKVELDPLVTEAGLTPMVTVAAGWVMETVADWLALPPEPVQVRL